MKIAIIIPAYNEEKRIGRTLEHYGRFFQDLKNKKKLDYEIIVVINNTRDRTEEIVKEAGRRYDISWLNFRQGGKGFAIIEGFKEALKKDFDLIGFVDADMSTIPESFYDLFRKIEKNDGVIASRWLKGSKIKTKQSFFRIITSRSFNILVRSILFLPYKDTQCGAKLFRKKAVKAVINELGITRWAFDIDLLYRLRRKGFKIVEIPTTWNDEGGSKLSMIKVPFQMFSAVIRLRLIYSPFSFVVKLYNKLPEKMKVHNW